MKNQKMTGAKTWTSFIALHCVLYTILLIPVSLILFPSEPYTQLLQYYTATYVVVGVFLFYNLNIFSVSEWLFRVQIIISIIYVVLITLLINFSFQKPLLTLPIILSCVILELLFFTNRKQYRTYSTVIHVILGLHDCVYCYVMISMSSNFDQNCFPIKWLFALTTLINCIILHILDQNEQESSNDRNEKITQHYQHACTIETNN